MRWFALLAACSAAAPPPPANAGPPTAKLLGEADFVALGFTSTPTRDGHLLCRGEDCWCFQPLDCGDCATRGRDVEQVRAASHDTRCDAEVGHLCGLGYLVGGFMYDGDTRYYDGDRLVGDLHSTDYPAYCGQQTSFAVRGVVPDCDQPVRDARSLCEPARAIPQRVDNPKERLLLP